MAETNTGHWSASVVVVERVAEAALEAVLKVKEDKKKAKEERRAKKKAEKVEETKENDPDAMEVDDTAELEALLVPSTKVK